MEQGIRVFEVQRREAFDLQPLAGGCPFGNVIAASVNGNIITPLGEARIEIFAVMLDATPMWPGRPGVLLRQFLASVQSDHG